MADDSWRTNAFRQSVVTKIDEAIRQSGMNTSRNSIEMENHVFQKAKNKEEYLGFVARLILHVREMKPKQGGAMAGPGQGQVGPGMPDPINALQNLASQGSRNPMINMGPQPGQMGGPQQPTATNLLQTLNRGPAQQMMLGNISGNMAGNMPMQDRQNIGMPPNGGQITNNQINNQMANQIRMQQMQNNALNQMPNQMQTHLGNQMQNPVQNQIGNQIPGQIQGQLQMQGNLGGAMANQIQNQMIEDSASAKRPMSNHDSDNDDDEENFFEVVSFADVDSVENSDIISVSSRSSSTIVSEDDAESSPLPNNSSAPNNSSVPNKLSGLADELSSFGTVIGLELAKIKDPNILRQTKRQIYNYVLDAQDLE